MRHLRKRGHYTLLPSKYWYFERTGLARRRKSVDYRFEAAYRTFEILHSRVQPVKFFSYLAILDIAVAVYETGTVRLWIDRRVCGLYTFVFFLLGALEMLESFSCRGFPELRRKPWRGRFVEELAEGFEADFLRVLRTFFRGFCFN